MNKAISNIWIIIFGAIIIIILVGIGAFFAGKRSMSTLPSPSLIPSTTAPAPTLIITSSPTPAVTPTPSVDDTSAIKLALINKTGIEEANLDFKITDNRTKWAKGNVKEKSSEVGGGYFLAAKIDSQWMIVYDGQATPTCSQIAAYSFPSDMVPECLDNSGNVVTR